MSRREQTRLEVDAGMVPFMAAATLKHLSKLPFLTGMSLATEATFVRFRALMNCVDPEGERYWSDDPGTKGLECLITLSGGRSEPDMFQCN